MSRFSNFKAMSLLLLGLTAAPAMAASSYCAGVKANALRSLGSAGSQRPLSATAQKRFVAALKLCALELDLNDYAPNLKVSDVISARDLEMGRTDLPGANRLLSKMHKAGDKSKTGTGTTVRPD
jgi:hypothetical protein